MKSLIAAIIFTLTSSAFASTEFRDVEESMCPGLKEISHLVALCTKVGGAREVYNTSLKNKVDVDALPEIVEFYNVIELGIWPDDSTSMMYMYSSILFNDEGRQVGYRVFHAYHNTEMESVIKLETRYNLRGKLVSIDLIY